MGESAQRHALVLDTVRAAHHGNVRVPRGDRVVNGWRVLGLGGDDHDIIGSWFDFGKQLDGFHLHRLGAIGGSNRQAALANRGDMSGPSNEHNLRTTLTKPTTHQTADGACPIDDDAHIS
jgi:hypothetical protein